MKGVWIALASSIVLAGCMTGGMNGMIRDSGAPVTMTYVQGMTHDNYTIVLPDGETFRGKGVMVGNSTTFANTFANTSITGTSTYTGPDGIAQGSHFGSTQGSAFSVVSSYTGNVAAVLFGDNGNTMRCAFQYADTSGLTNLGGVGLCETSEGRVIDVQW